jgi:class 3 adenylate cyclase/tetratricopeptide (TPR) repeat protein
MITCQACGFEAADDSVFCSKCGAKLGLPASPVEERKTVTTLFCDLVAFTAMSEAADPEDIDALLGRYHEDARKVIENHGGTVEMFIGDAVVGVFGVPAVHEDDPERAVRAGLRIVGAMEGMVRPDGSPLQARVGINTGEALVRLDVDPLSGRGFLTGDAVNVAARLEAAAPPMGVAVGATTHDLSNGAIVYEKLPPVAAKGKAEPIAAWLALAPVARTGTHVVQPDATPFVGREMELAYLGALFDRVLSSASPQFALLVGEPGIGKSRLVSEFAARLDERSELVTWRQGHCLPYGEGVTFWALGEIVKAHAGVLDTDTPAVADEKLGRVLPAGPDREWFRQRLRALLGLEAPQAEREENFVAWLRFLEDLAGNDPTVLVFEDLHWADEALLAFLEYVAINASAVPLFVIATARPELLEEHPSLVAAPRVNRISLEVPSEKETTSLVTAVLGDVAEEVRAGIVTRAQGNPFYAEESAWLALDRACLDDVPLAGSVQAVIAHRLDALPVEMKAAVADAAVIGEVFWGGAVAALGQRSQAETDAALQGLMVKQLVHRARASTMAGESEFAFAHALARDVAYTELPRGARARKHAAAATWIEAKAGERAEDLAEVLAHHYAAALDFARAAGDAGLATAAVGPAVEWVRVAGDRAQSVDVATARRHYVRGLEIAGTCDVDRVPLLAGLGESLLLAGESSAAADVLEEAVVLARESEKKGDLVRLLLRLNYAIRASGHGVRSELLDEAVSVARARGPSLDLVEAVGTRGGYCWITTGDARAALDAADEALAICERYGLEVTPYALTTRGGARCALGDAEGLEDYRRGLAIAQDPSNRGLGYDLSAAMSDYVVVLDWVEGPAAALPVSRDYISFCERRGMVGAARFMRGAAIEGQLLCGEWTDLPAIIEELEESLSDVDDPENLQTLKAVQTMLNAWLGHTEDLERALARMESLRPHVFLVSMNVYDAIASAVGALALGRLEVAATALCRWADTPEPGSTIEHAWMVPEAIRTALRCSGSELAERLRHRGDGHLPVQEAVMASIDGLLDEAHERHDVAVASYSAAAAHWRDRGTPYEEGQALLGQGRCLLVLGKAPEAAAPLAAARDIFSRLGAKPALAETDELLLQLSSA